MENEKKNPRHQDWRAWIITATLVIQLLTAIEYYHRWMEFHALIDLENQVTQCYLESLKGINQLLEERSQNINKAVKSDS